MHRSLAGGVCPGDGIKAFFFKNTFMCLFSKLGAMMKFGFVRK